MFLRQSVALITGGAQGLGKGFAKAVLDAGGKVSLLDVKEEVGARTLQEFQSQFGSNSALFIKCDVRSQQEVEAAFKKTHQVFGKLDVVVNNAGVTTHPTINDWERTVDINLKAVMRCCYIAAEHMAASGGHIINIASMAGLTGIPFDAPYAAAKHGVVGLSRSLSVLWESKSVRISCLCPAFADTEMFQNEFRQHDEAAVDAAISATGLMTVADVVEAFKKLLYEEDKTGGVLMVRTGGIEYRYKPRVIQKSKL